MNWLRWLKQEAMTYAETREKYLDGSGRGFMKKVEGSAAYVWLKGKEDQFYVEAFKYRNTILYDFFTWNETTEFEI